MTERPISAPLARKTDETWKQVVELFADHRLPPPPWQLRDDLVIALEWAWYGYALASPAEVVERPAPVSHVAGSDREDAERFRALMRCGRIKMQGSSGVDPKTGERNGNNVHFGAEFWPEPIPAGFEEHYEASTKWGRFCIKALADAILEEEARATPAPSPNMRGDLGITEIATLRRAVGLADAIRAAQRAYMADRGNERLGRAVGEACEAYDAHRSGNPSPQPREDVSSTPQQEPARLREEIERLEKALETAREALEAKHGDFVAMGDKYVLKCFELAKAREDAIEEAAKVADDYIGMGWRGSELPAAVRALSQKKKG